MIAETVLMGILLCASSVGVNADHRCASKLRISTEGSYADASQVSPQLMGPTNENAFIPRNYGRWGFNIQKKDGPSPKTPSHLNGLQPEEVRCGSANSVPMIWRDVTVVAEDGNLVIPAGEYRVVLHYFIKAEDVQRGGQPCIAVSDWFKLTGDSGYTSFGPVGSEEDP